jgi:glutamate-1-semialdehyde 2,1-aminomutase
MLAQETIMQRQQTYLQNLMERYIQRTQTSKNLTQKHRSVLADPRVSDGFNQFFKEMFYPIVAQRSQGAKFWDVDGNEYIDLLMGFGVNLFGHNPDFIKQAIQVQLEKGIQLGQQSELVGEVAQLICEFTGMERVFFSNTGTEAVMSAVRLARAATKRSKIVIFSGSYHGHFDGTLVKDKPHEINLSAIPLDAGILPKFVEDVLILEYGNIQSIEQIQSYQNELAAVLVEPVQSSRPYLQPKEFLQQLRQVTQQAGIALIFDEMVTGFRIHPGGAQAWFGVPADIATYGKIVGGGMPIGVVAGKAKFMDQIDGGMWNYGDDSYPTVSKTFVAGTFCKHPLSIAAAHAVLTYLKAQGTELQAQLNQKTAQFVNTLNTYFLSENLPIQLANFGSLFGTGSGYSEAESENADSQSLDLLIYHLLDRGIYIRGGRGYLSTAHTDEDIERIFQAVQSSVEELKEGGFLPG